MRVLQPVSINGPRRTEHRRTVSNGFTLWRALTDLLLRQWLLLAQDVGSPTVGFGL